MASIVYGNHDGHHGVILLEVESSQWGTYLANQVERSVYLESRVEGLRVECHDVHAVIDAIAVASRLAAR